MRGFRHGLALLACGLAAAGPVPSASGRTLDVGRNGPLHSLAEAVAAAADGDTIRLGPGTYFECAVLSQTHLVIAGAGPDTVLTDHVCEDKALLVVRGDGLTVRDLVLARARTPEENGAGIRLEGQGLTLERVGFDNDQVGVLAAMGGAGRILVTDCAFTGGGVGGDRAKSALMVGPVALLRVSGSRFSGGRGGQVASDAVRTELEGNRIESASEPGTAFPVRAGGALAMRDNVMVLGAAPPPRGSAVLATGPGVEMRGNRLENGTGAAARLLLDWSGGARLDDNVVPAGDSVSGSEGSWRHQAGTLVRGLVGDARAAAGQAKRAVKAAVGR